MILCGNGESTSFWNDPWINDNTLRALYPSLFALEGLKDTTVAERVTLHNGVHSWNWSWTRPPLTELEVRSLQDCVQLISSKQWYKNKKDIWVWGDVVDGENIVHFIRMKLDNHNQQQDVKLIQWNSWVPPKVNTLVWRANMDRIPTREALSKRRILIQNLLCPSCGEQIESNDHVFTSCNFVNLVWTIISTWLKIPPIFAFSFNDLLKIHDFASKDKTKKKIIQAIVYSTIWCVWKQRNEKIFKGTPTSVTATIGCIKAITFLWIRNRSKCLNIEWENWCAFNF